jgi:hypothetical protein
MQVNWAKWLLEWFWLIIRYPRFTSWKEIVSFSGWGVNMAFRLKKIGIGGKSLAN